MVSLVADLHDMGFYHRDLKPGNMFYESDESSIDKIKLIMIDYAFASDVTHDKKYKGTKRYMAQEMQEKDKENAWYNETIDTFSTGISSLDFLSGYLMNVEDVDMGLMIIIEAMIDNNYCVNKNKNGVFCQNKELYWDEKFIDLESVKEFIENKNKKTCTLGENE